MRPSLVRSLLVLVMLAPLSSCGGDGGGEDLVSQVTSVSVTPASPRLSAIGTTVTLSATAKDGSGKSLPDATITWSSSNPSVADVSVSGVVTAFANGSTVITATAASAQAQASGTATVTVAQTAATVALTAPRDTLRAGETMQLSATSADAGGTPIASPTYMWASSDTTVATVDASGLVTGVGSGSTTLSATLDGASGEAELSVLFVSVKVGNDTTLAGRVVADTFEVAAGVTVTAEQDFELVATGPVTVAGTITGDCVGLTIGGQSSVTISGTLANTCTDAAAEGGDVTVRADGALSLTGVTLNTSGEVVLANAAAAAGPSASPGAGSRAALAALSAPQRATAADSPCEFRGVKIAQNPPKAAMNRNGRGLLVRCLGTATFWGGNGFQAQSGGDGKADNDDNDAFADDGGNGGSVRIEVLDGDMIFMDEAHGGITGTQLVAGDGGRGGDAVAEADDPGEDADALAGDGGFGGDVGLETSNGSIKVMEFNGLTVLIGSGGPGGDGIVVAGDGKDAGEEAAQPGGAANGTGGPGGDAGDVIILPTGGTFEGVENVIQNGGNGGTGGTSSVHGGKGGNGNAAFPNGAKGGDMTAKAGNGGDATPGTGVRLGTGGNGGLWLLSGGMGGDGVTLCPTGNGGNGGAGGAGLTLGGSKGSGSPDGLSGAEVVADGTADGGAGGDGLVPGTGGKAGDDDTDENHPNAFRDGPDGQVCTITDEVDVDVVVDDDPAGHDPFVQMYLVSLLEIVIHGNEIAFNGEPPWINLMGTLEGDNFSATGDGTAAGIPGVDVKFEGTVTRDAEGHVVHIEGMLTVGSNGALFGIPIVYDVTSK